MSANKFLYNVLSAVSLTIVAAFAIWWFNPAHLPHNFHGDFRAFDVLLFLVLSYILWHPIVMEVLAWAIGSNVKEEAAPNLPLPGLKVAFVTTFVPGSESIELLYKTLPAMAATDYPHDTWVLDEGNDPRVRQFCQSIGVNHFSRAGQARFNTDHGKFARKTKGGNHNSWYESFGNGYDIVAQIDTDFIPSQTFLTKTLGYFHDPAVAFVGTPQIYGNTQKSFIARGAAQQTYNFYGPILRGLHAMDTTMLIGANHVVRVAALKDVDHYSAHITEDLLTGMKLHSKKWKSVYVPETLAIGEGPSTWQAYFNQQMRWAYGCMDVLLKHSPRLLWHMNWRRKLYYLWIQQHYFSGLAMIASLAGLGLYFFFGINTAQVSPVPFIKLYGLVLVACALMTWRLQKYNVRPDEERGFMMAGRVLSIACWPVFFLAFIGVIRGKRLTYKVTRKGHNEIESPMRIPLRMFSAHLMIGFYCLLCVAAALLEHHRSIIMLAWAASTAALMFCMPFILISYHIMESSNQIVTASMEWLVKRYRLFELNNAYKYVKRRHPHLIGLSLVSFAAATISESFLISAQHQAWMIWPLYGYLPALLVSVYYLFAKARPDFGFLTQWNYQPARLSGRYNQAGFVYNIYNVPGAEPVVPVIDKSVDQIQPVAANPSRFEQLLAEAEAKMAAQSSSQP